MSSQYASELCTLLVEDNFGEVFAHIFATLLRYERLPLLRLKSYCHLSFDQLRKGLAAMIQHHLVFHFTSYDDGITYYEADLHTAYYLARSGKILELIEETLGNYAATVMSTIMFLGHAQVSHLETLPETEPKQVKTNGTSEEHNEQQTGLDDEHLHGGRAHLHATLKMLAAHGYIIRVREAHFQSPNDVFLDAERAVKSRSDIKEMKGKRHEEAVKEAVAELIKERMGGDLTHGLIYKGVPFGVKRRHAVASSDAPNKRRKVDYTVVDGDDMDDESEWSDDDTPDETIPMESGLVVRINYAKLDVALRNRRFVELAEQETSAATAHVYECLLRRIEYQTSCCRETVEIPREGEEGEHHSVLIPLNAVAEDIDPQVDLTGSIGPMDSSQPLNRRGKRPLENGINSDDHEGTNSVASGGNRIYDVDQHLYLLAQPPYAFAGRKSMSGLPHWAVEFRNLARKLRHLELERMIESRYGDVALRIVRVLHTKGKLDEKRLQEISLLPFKDLRQVLASMQSGGFVDLQEVPRDAQRQPSRTIFLWFYDPDRVRNSVLEDTYKAMSRCLQRLKFERSRLRDFLDKAERSDVKGNEELYLSEAELKILGQWKAKEALLLGEVARLDDMVAVFRDY